jgi:hypothetical protein
MGGKSLRILNGYRVLHDPSHPKAMRCENWAGYVYEHVLVAEQSLGRPLFEDEVVHHLDGDRANNRFCNLMVVHKAQHPKIEHWLSCGAPSVKAKGANRMNSGKPKWKKPSYCDICGRTLQMQQKSRCSAKCRSVGSLRKPPRETLEEDLRSKSLLAVGKKYGVSDNAVRKWMRRYGLHKATLSQAADASAEGAETTGEVKSS